MKSLVLTGPRELTWHDVEEPTRRLEREAIVRPLAVATCDLDQPMIFGQVPVAYPISLGHECIAEVVDGPEPFTPGQRVVVPFQISCGTCRPCSRGLTGNCAAVPMLSMYGFGALGGTWGGMLSDLALVPFAAAMLVPVPDGLESATVASAADNITDGWRTVAPALAEIPGADVLIVSGGFAPSIPLYAADVALALGAASVTYVDTDPNRLAVAEKLGATVTDEKSDHIRGAYPVTVDGTGTAEGLVAALRQTEPGGRCTSIGQMDIEGTLPLLELYTKGVRLDIGRAMARPAIPAILDLIAADRLRPDWITSATASWDDAPHALLEPTAKLVISRD